MEVLAALCTLTNPMCCFGLHCCFPRVGVLWSDPGVRSAPNVVLGCRAVPADVTVDGPELSGVCLKVVVLNPVW